MWKGKGSKEYGVDFSTSKVLVEISPRYYRHTK